MIHNSNDENALKTCISLDMNCIRIHYSTKDVLYKMPFGQNERLYIPGMYASIDVSLNIILFEAC